MDKGLETILGDINKEVFRKAEIVGNLIEKPMFSIIVATYNRAQLLPRAINSVLVQSYQNFEIIIVDDSSNDNTEEVVNLFKKKDQRIIYYKFKENMGVSAVWNKGLDLARGNYVAFLDDDDELTPEALETAVNKFAELSQYGVKVIWFDSVDSITGKLLGYGINKDDYISYEGHLCGKVSGDFWIVIDRSLFGENRFDTRTWGGYSLPLWLKVFYQAKVFHIGKALHIMHREHGSTVTNDFRIKLKHKEKYLWTHKIFLQEHGKELERLCPKIYGSSLANLGLFHLLNCEKVEGRKVLLKSLRFRFSIKVAILIPLTFILNKRQIAFFYIKFGNVKK